AHRRADQDERTFGQPVDRRERFFQPGIEGAFGEISPARSGARIIEAEHSEPAFFRKRTESERLRSLHVRGIAGQEDDRRRCAPAQPIGNRTSGDFDVSDVRLAHESRALAEEEVPMKYRKLGSSDLEVSEISLGSWLTYGVGVEADKARACLEEAFAQQINFIDTANVYGRGAAETFLGEALQGRPRD